MEQTTTNLYELLPVIYRQRDHEHGEPLKALLQVMSEQLELVEGDILNIRRHAKPAVMLDLEG